MQQGVSLDEGGSSTHHQYQPQLIINEKLKFKGKQKQETKLCKLKSYPNPTKKRRKKSLTCEKVPRSTS
jgi:hypothetical protein